MCKVCTSRVVCMRVAWSAYVKENTTHLMCVLYILDMHCLFMNPQLSLTIDLITITLR